MARLPAGRGCVTLSRSVNVLVAVIFAYLASFVDQMIYSTYELPPVVVQIVCLAALLGCLLIDLTGGRSFALSRAEVAFIALLVGYVAWIAVTYTYSSQSADALQRLVTQSKAAMFVVVSVPLFRRPGASNAISFASIVVVVLGSVLSVFDFFVPTFSSVPGRGAGFYENPNITGFMLVALAVVASSRLGVINNYLLWAAVIPGVLVTFSRSGWLLLIIALIGQALLGRLGGGRGRFVFVGSVGLLLSVLFLTYVSGALYDFVASSDFARYLDPNTVQRLGGYGAALDDAASLERAQALQRGLEAFYSAPLLGHGLGYTVEWDLLSGPHNLYVFFLAESGLVGFSILCSILGVTILNARREARFLAVLFSLGSIFSDNMLDQPGTALMLALAISGANGERRKLVTAAPPEARARGGQQRRPAFQEHGSSGPVATAPA
jgi:O-antigen ligase